MEHLYADGKNAEILARAEACLPKDETGNFAADREKSDAVHDLLAFLAEKQSYYEHDYESFLAVLKKNIKMLQIDPARREPADALRAEFEGSMGKQGPLRERIRQTDELIDRGQGGTG
ncbi:MAG: hypothetical protein A4E49_03306 [Methanosaeta sp. PtaU1.Bin112]|nr:MAG: hypothetical protein A4E49_03306 [Methanosaeta sp. PtaU1.Bin112]